MGAFIAVVGTLVAAVRRGAPVLTVLALAGCAPAVQVKPASFPTVKAGEAPTIGQRSTAAMGAVMYSQYRYASSDAFVTTADFSRSLPPFASVQVPANTPLRKASLSGRDVLCTATAAFSVPGDRRSVCFYSKAADRNSFDTMWIAGYPESTGTYDITPLPYKTGEVFASDGFKYELLYQGVDNRTLRISYREYSGNIARPAFQQDLTYTLAQVPPTSITFRSVRVEVHSANNDGIDYTVLSSFIR